MGLTDMPKPVPIEILQQRALSVFEVLLGLLFNALKRQTRAHFPRAEPKPLEMESFILNTKIAVRPPEKHFLLQ